jgi:hypothetical protein
MRTFKVLFMEAREMHLTAPVIYAQAEAALVMFEFFLSDARNNLPVFYGAWQQLLPLLDTDVRANGQIFEQVQRARIVYLVEQSIQALGLVGQNADNTVRGCRFRLAPFQAYLA